MGYHVSLPRREDILLKVNVGKSLVMSTSIYQEDPF
jgi:hypothetical protein